MAVNYFCWSLCISLTAIIFLYPLQRQINGAFLGRICAAIFVFPSFIASLLTLKLIKTHNVVLHSMSKLPLVPLRFGFVISEDNIAFVLALHLMIVMVILLLPRRNFLDFIVLSSLSALALFTMIAAPELLMKTMAISMLNVFGSFILLNHDPQIFSSYHMRIDFLLQRLSDLLAFIAVLHIYLHSETLSFTLFFIAMTLRMASLTCSYAQILATRSSNFKLVMLERMSLTLATQILTLQIVANTQTLPHQLLIISFALGIFTIALIIFWIYRRQNAVFYLMNNSIFSATWLLISCGYSSLAQLILLGLLVMMPMSYAFAFATSVSTVPSPTQSSLFAFFSKYITNALFVVPERVFQLVANIFINIINVLYSGFLLFLLPQVITTAVQIPLRFFTNGNLQRSLLLVGLTMMIVISWWRI